MVSTPQEMDREKFPQNQSRKNGTTKVLWLRLKITE